MALPSKEYDCESHNASNCVTVATNGGKLYGFCRRCDRRFEFDQEGNVIRQTRLKRAQQIDI